MNQMRMDPMDIRPRHVLKALHAELAGGLNGRTGNFFRFNDVIGPDEACVVLPLRRKIGQLSKDDSYTSLFLTAAR